MLRDLSHAVRVLRRSPGYTFAAVFALALGIGANTTIFSMLHAVLLRSLPYPGAERLTLIRLRMPRINNEPVRLPAGATLFFQEHTSAFDAFASYEPSAFDLVERGAPERVAGIRCSSTLGTFTGAAPLKMGRWFTEREDTEARRVAVISFALWQRRFGRDAGVLGKTVTLRSQPYQIIGVTAAGYQFPPAGVSASADVFIPNSFPNEERAQLFDNFNHFLLARTRPGVSAEQAGEDVRRAGKLLQDKLPTKYRGLLDMEGVLSPYKGYVVSEVKPLLLLLMGAVGFVLLIAVVNVASLALSHIVGRQHELAIRAAIGATRGRVIRQLATESLLLGVLAVATGLLAASWSLHGLMAAMPQEMPRSAEIRLDATVLFFAFGIALVASLAAGLIPGWLILRRDPEPLLRQGGRGMTRSAHRGAAAALIVAEFAIAFVLLAGAGLLLRSFINAYGASVGFQPDQALSFSLSLPKAVYAKPEQIQQFEQRLLDRLVVLPGVQNAGIASDIPLNSDWHRAFTPERPVSEDSQLLIAHSDITGDYFAAIGARLWRGRLFTSADQTAQPTPVIVNKSMAVRYWGGEQALGQHLKFSASTEPGPWSTIVGIVDDVKDDNVEEPAGPHSYTPGLLFGQLNVALRTSGQVQTLAPAVRQIVAELDPSLPVVKMMPMRELVDEKVANRRFRTGLLALFAAIALGLALLGVYSAIRNSVAQRTAEIGVRMALGADQPRVVKMILSEAGGLIFLGIGVGLAGAFALGRLLESFLFGVKAYDLLTLAITSLVLGLAGVLACLMPARAASRLDPIVALRSE